MAAAAATLVRAFRFTRALRFRIAVSYVVFFAVLLTALGFFFRKELANIFDAQTQDSLKDDWDAVKGYLRLDTPTGPNWFYDPADPDESFTVRRLQRVYMLADSEGHVLQWSTIYKNLGFEDPASIKEVLKSGDKSPRIRYDPQHVPYMILSGPIVDDRHHVYYIAIGRAIENNQKALREFTFVSLIILPLAVVVSAFFGWFMAGRALAPVNDVAQTAERITHSNLNMRLQSRGAFDELDRLIDSFNRMMERLNLSFEQMRQFSMDVSHELRTPLTVIRGQLEVAVFTANTVEQYREAMLNALEDVERLSNIVRALLLLSQAESGQLVLNKTDMDICEMVRDLSEQYQIAAEAANVELTSDVRAGQHRNIYADKIQMERLFTNLLTNAIKYTPAGGHVRVRVEPRADTVQLIVEDNGVGIAADHLPHIFDRFYRVPSADPNKGLGLGLSFVAWIVKAHGGTIDVQSELQKGTKFTIALPESGRRTVPEGPAFSEEQLNETVEHPEQPNPVN